MSEWERRGKRWRERKKKETRGGEGKSSAQEVSAIVQKVKVSPNAPQKRKCAWRAAYTRLIYCSCCKSLVSLVVVVVLLFYQT